jgi:Caspase domain
MLAGSKTLAIILGASQWEDYPTLDGSPSFEKSASYFSSYLCSYRGLRLPPLNICNLFDQKMPPDAMIKTIKNFIKDKLRNNPDISDLIIYYVGHGSYLNDKEYFLAIRSLSQDAKDAGAFKVSYLRDIITEVALEKRTLIILDACYSGAAMAEFARLPAVKLVHDSLTPNEVKRGVVLFCAAGGAEYAINPAGSDFTMFSGALLHVLENGNVGSNRYLSLSEFGQLVKDHISDRFGAKAVPAQIHVPVHDLRDILKDPYFPNAAFPITDLNDRVDDLYEQIEKINSRLTVFSGQASSNTVVAALPSSDVEDVSAWRGIILEKAESNGGLRDLTIDCLHKLHGGKLARREIIEYVVDNLIRKVCDDRTILCEEEQSTVLLKKSTLPGHFIWEEDRSLILYSPLGEGEEVVFGDTSFLVDENQVDAAIAKMELRVKIDGRRIVFAFSDWWKRHKPGKIRPGDSFADDEATASYDGRSFAFKYQRKVVLDKIRSQIEYYESSYLAEHDRFYALTVARPTMGLKFNMQLIDLDNWKIDPPTLAATFYHTTPDKAPKSELIRPGVIQAHAPSLVLPGLALLVKWGPQ